MNAVEFPSHRHPLNLKESSSEETEESRVCGLCGETEKGSGGYECSECDFAAHLGCAENPPSLVIERSRIHEHTLTLLPRQVSFNCNACGLSGDKSPYVCLKCSFMTHKDCIDLPRVIKINRHAHRVVYTFFLGPGEWTCGVCRRRMDGRYGAYSCLRCAHYAVHPRCATRKDVWDGTEVEGNPEEEDEEEGVKSYDVIDDGVIQHFSHKQDILSLRLQDEYTEDVWDGMELEGIPEEEDGEDGGESDFVLIPADSIVHFGHEQHILSRRLQDKFTDDVCSGCALPIATETVYSCQECPFFLHEICANLPRRNFTFLHVHPLTLCPGDERSGGPNGPSRCDSCHLHFSGFSYRCLKCKDDNIKFDIRCSSVSLRLKVYGHKHQLVLDDVPTDEIGEAKICSGCGLEGPKYILSCLECSLHLCVTCAALPDEAKYKYDEHLLSIHTGLEDSTGRYLCDVCEKKIEEKGNYYKCFSCGPVLHTNCAVGSFRHMRPGLSFTSHGHEYKVVRNEWTSQLRCSNCDNDCHEPLLLMSTTTTDVTIYLCSSRCFTAYVPV